MGEKAEKLEAGLKTLQDADDCKSLLKKYLTQEVSGCAFCDKLFSRII